MAKNNIHKVYSVRMSLIELQMLERLAKHLERRRGDTVRYVIRQAARELDRELEREREQNQQKEEKND